MISEQTNVDLDTARQAMNIVEGQIASIVSRLGDESPIGEIVMRNLLNELIGVRVKIDQFALAAIREAAIND